MMSIDADTVHLWTDQFVPGAESGYLSVLNPAEQARMQRFIKVRDRLRYIWARGKLRYLLAAYVGEAAAAVQFQYETRGKPYLAEHPVQFNISHSGDWLVIAVVRDRAIGVDIEQIQATKSWLALAERFFRQSESQALKALPPHEQTTAFFKLWTRKEAFLKATGQGLQGLPNLELAVHQSHQSVTNGQGQWEIRDLDHIPNYAGAVSLQIPGQRKTIPPPTQIILRQLPTVIQKQCQP
ncbi:MAG: 4'-phosphopantetheinyl transferase superfamily protein [Spirulina sp. SIO3F2]|nr:4'-phosphopantetheinyl transferase superfamily protein [Spirulina sp. SIO3F2]